MSNHRWIVIGIIFIFQIGSASASTLTATQALSFGTLIPITGSGSVSVSMNGALNTNGSVSLAPIGTSYYPGLMNFQATGLSAILEVVTITVLDNSVSLNNSTQGGGSVTVSNFVTTPSVSVNLLNPNINNIPIGATMTFNSLAKGGNYTGSVRVRANGLLSGTANATIPIRLTLWNTLKISQVTQLDFGAIERLSGGSIVRINPQTGARNIVSGSGGISLVGSIPFSAGKFNVSGEPRANFSISLPSSTTLSGNNGGTMMVNNFTGHPSSTSATLDNNGTIDLYVGADLNIGNNQTAGTYTGTYTVTVNY